jgi:hypothetical protein
MSAHRRASAQAPVDPVQHFAIISSRNAARLVRQQRLYDRPFKIRQLVTAWGHDNSFQEFESFFTPFGNPVYEFVT